MFLVEKQYDLGIEGVTEDMNSEEVYELSCKQASKVPIDGNPLIRRFQLETLVLKINAIERDRYLLKKIQESDLDVAVVGLAHAINWKDEGLPFNFWMEDFGNNVEFQPLDTRNLQFDNAEYLDGLNWKLSFGDKNRTAPKYMGLRNHYAPETFFEIFEEKGQLYLRDSFGKFPVEVSLQGNDFRMKQDFRSKEYGEETLEYEGQIENGLITGSIKGRSSDFVITEFKRTPYEMMQQIYLLPNSRWHLINTPERQTTNISNPIPEELKYLIKKDRTYSDNEVPF
jgi:hypothetical protein